MKLEIIRMEYADDVTYGVLKLDGHMQCLTLEKPWLDNAVDISCIPEGNYECKKHISVNHGTCIKVLDVKDRTNILIHKGNTTNDSSGCILVGKSYGQLKGLRAVLDSKVAFGELMSLIPDTISMTIRSA